MPAGDQLETGVCNLAAKYIHIFGIMHIFLQFLHLGATFFINLLNGWTNLVVGGSSAI